MTGVPLGRVILITGATGLLGSEILHGYLQAEEELEIKVLIRGGEEEGKTRLARLVADENDLGRARFAERVQPIWGDAAQPRLGLLENDYGALAERVTDIIHSAASIDFALPLESARAVNYQGTVNLVELAHASPRLRAFAHISTAHVAGKRTGVILEDELEHSTGFVNSYEQSKYEAEQFLRTRMGDLPIAVYRSTTIIGDSQSGAVRQFNFFHTAMRFAYHGLVPALPGEPRGHVDLIPVDYAARAIQYLVDQNFRPGTTYHICAEPSRSFTLQELVDTTFDLLVSSPSSKRRTLDRFPVVDVGTFNRLVQNAQETKQTRLLQALVPLTYFMPHLARPKVFDASNARRDLLTSGLSVPNVREYYPKIVEYCLRTDWGRRSVAGDNHRA